VPLTADPADYLPWRGDLACGLRVSNHILRRARTLRWDFHQRAFAGVPMTLVGHNPELPGAHASRNWNELKDILSHHRFFVHTAQPDLEDGYNMATLEAMAAGLPVLGNPHPTSPIVDGVDGLLSDDPAKLNACARRLLADRELAAQMGRAAQQTVVERFSGEAFRTGVLRAIQAAQERCKRVMRSVA
jgi:glycosyltransferase involved in cell wall biosynthesis